MIEELIPENATWVRIEKSAADADYRRISVKGGNL